MQVLCLGRSKVSASRPYAPDTRRGVLSRTLTGALVFQSSHSGSVANSSGTGNEINLPCEVSGCTNHRLILQALPQFRTAAYAVTASTEQLPGRARCRCGNARIPSDRMITCTGRPDESDARNGRLQPAGCARTGSLHDRGRHESGGCNGSRLPAVPDTSRRRQPWRSE